MPAVACCKMIINDSDDCLSQPRSMPQSHQETTFGWSVAKRQLLVMLILLALLASIVAILYLQDRRQEWRLRGEQATHRLDLAWELITRELDLVRSDALFLAEQKLTRDFAAGNRDVRKALEAEFGSFIQHKRSFDQVRLLDRSGKELVRVDATPDGRRVVPLDELQDKSDRYYVRQSVNLQSGEVFVSEFDLNQERGRIEEPLNPVIRFVTPVVDDSSRECGLLVLNYLGKRLLRELQGISLPGHTMLLRPDGQFLLSPLAVDQWGWLLGHEQTFPRCYPDAWKHVLTADGSCRMTADGVFAARPVKLRPPRDVESLSTSSSADSPAFLIVSWLPAPQVFSISNQLLQRLLLLVAVLLIPLFFLTRYWATSSARRELWNRQIHDSEQRLRVLSGRLLRIQEEERQAISREIHDELGQQMTAINLDLKLARQDAGTDEGQRHLTRAIGGNEQLLHALHDFAQRVRPSTLDDLGLIEAVQSHVWEFQQRTGMEVETDLSLADIEIPPVVAENAFRILQESLTNVARHANATRVVIHLGVNQQATPPVLQLTVADDGVGQAGSESDGNRLGIVGMQERVDLLNGELKITSQKEHGTSVQAGLPIVQDHGGSA